MEMATMTHVGRPQQLPADPAGLPARRYEVVEEERRSG